MHRWILFNKVIFYDKINEKYIFFIFAIAKNHLKRNFEIDIPSDRNIRKKFVKFIQINKVSEIYKCRVSHFSYRIFF